MAEIVDHVEEEEVVTESIEINYREVVSPHASSRKGKQRMLRSVFGRRGQDGAVAEELAGDRQRGDGDDLAIFAPSCDDRAVYEESRSYSRSPSWRTGVESTRDLREVDSSSLLLLPCTIIHTRTLPTNEAEVQCTVDTVVEVGSPTSQQGGWRPRPGPISRPKRRSLRRHSRSNSIAEVEEGRDCPSALEDNSLQSSSAALTPSWSSSSSSRSSQGPKDPRRERKRNLLPKFFKSKGSKDSLLSKSNSSSNSSAGEKEKEVGDGIPVGTRREMAPPLHHRRGRSRGVSTTNNSARVLSSEL